MYRNIKFDLEISRLETKNKARFFRFFILKMITFDF